MERDRKERLAGKRRSVRGRRRHWYLPIAFGALAAILSIWGLIERQNRYEHSQAVRSAIETNQSRVRSFEQYVRRTVATADLISWHAAYLAHWNPPGRCPDAPVDDPVLSAAIVSSVLLLLDNQICPVSGSAKIGQTVAEKLRRNAQASTRDLIVGPPVKAHGQDLLVPVIRVIDRAKGNVAVVLLERRRFTDFARDIPFSKADTISLIGLDAVVRARRVGDHESAGEAVRGLVMQRQLASPNGTYLGPSVLDGIPRYFSHRRLPEVDLFVTSGVPVADIENVTLARRNVNYVIAAIASVCILMAAAFLAVTTRRRQRQLEELTEANYRLNEAQQIGSIGDWDYFADEDVLVWSENLRRMYGRGDHEVYSSLAEIQRYLTPASTEETEAKILEVAISGVTLTWEIDVEIEGTAKLIRVIAAPIRNDVGTIVGVHGTDQDITAEADLRALQQRVAELARLDSMSAVTATLAHELNQPLGAAINYMGAASRLIAAHPELDGRIQSYLSSARGQIEHLAQIITSARALVSPSSAPTDRVDIRKLINEVILLLQASRGNIRTHFEVDIDPAVTSVAANRAQLKQVLFNLAKNGIEAVPADRQSVIRFITTAEHAASLLFKVADNGAGIDGLDDPFETLATTKPRGLGLGLALARTIIEAQGGEIWIEKTGRNGTIAAFTIPRGRC